VAGNRIAARLVQPAGAHEIRDVLRPWLH
jgi:hypothetical protein